MKKQYIESADRILLRKRAVTESVNDLLKNFFQAEHSRHRSFFGFAANLFSALIAYTFYPKKPHMRGIDLEKALITLIEEEKDYKKIEGWEKKGVSTQLEFIMLSEKFVNDSYQIFLKILNRLAKNIRESYGS